MNCKVFQDKLPTLILDAGSLDADVKQHLAGCRPCEYEYSSLIAALSAMDAWEVPEPSIYFDQKLAVMLREEQRAPRLGLFAKLKDRILFNTGRQFRPAVMGILALGLMLGGGSYASLEGFQHHSLIPQVSAAVNDLQSLDKNEPALQQMDELLQDDDSSPNKPKVDAPS